MIHRLSAVELGRKLAARELGCEEVAQSFLDRIEARSDLGAFLTVDRDHAMGEARNAQARIDRGEGGPLTGVPYALKDNISTKGIRTTCASRILETYVPPFDATVTERLREAGAVLLGKTNLDEFAMGTSTENSAFFPARNPWDTDRSPGGSSGGSAAAVSAGLVPLALGSDTGGSIRQPASLCGIIGFKPTYGRCSRYGLVAFASSLDQIGPLAHTVEDAAVMAQVITGNDPRDATSLPDPPIDAGILKRGSLRGMRIGLPREFFGPSTDPGVRSVVERAIETIQSEGAEFEEVELPSIQYGVTTYYLIAPAEASSNLARFDGIRYGPRMEGDGHIDVVERTRARLFGHEVKARIMIGTYALSAGYYDAFYLKAQKVRALMQREFSAAFERFDLLLGPTSPVPAFRLGELSVDPMALKLLDFCTIPANLLGCPAISLNAGLVNGLPAGVQLMAPPMHDERLLQAAYAVEQVLGASARPPEP